MTQESNPRKKVTTQTFRVKKQQVAAITMLTAYDYPTALAVDQAGIDSILVGDSLGMVVLGYETTLPVTMADMLHHCKAVARATRYALTDWRYAFHVLPGFHPASAEKRRSFSSGSGDGCCKTGRWPGKSGCNPGDYFRRDTSDGTPGFNAPKRPAIGGFSCPGKNSRRSQEVDGRCNLLTGCRLF